MLQNLKSYFNISNLLSLSRGPLALLFIPQNTILRIAVLIAAALTDYLDGFIARRFNTTTRIGAVLDPVMDKFFIVTILCILVFEGSMETWQALLMVSRDLFLALFGLYLAITGTWKGYRPSAIWWGKVTTVGQYALLIASLISLPIPTWIYYGFLASGSLYLIELFWRLKRSLASA